MLFGEPETTLKSADETAVLRLKALEVILRQVVQWQRLVPRSWPKVRWQVPQRQVEEGMMWIGGV